MDIAVIGAGASGYAAAIEAARRGAGVTIFEKNSRGLKKLLASGGGRCNISNAELGLRHYHGGDPAFIMPALARFGGAETERFFMELGIPFVSDGGRLYPRSLSSAAVSDALRFEAEHLGVRTQTDAQISSIRPTRRGFSLAAPGGAVSARRVIVACGGAASPNCGGCADGYALLGSLGHALRPRLPSVVQLRSSSPLLGALAGQRFFADVFAVVDGKAGERVHDEVLFAPYGLSGPAVLAISGCCARALARGARVQAGLDLFPECSETDLARLLGERAALRPWLALGDFLTGLVLKRVGQSVIKSALACGQDRPCGGLTSGELAALARVMKDWRFDITAPNGLESAQVTAGGASTDDFFPETLMSRLIPGVFACGEVLDIDGDCGGYNLQWAWSSGRLAGACASESLTE